MLIELQDRDGLVEGSAEKVPNAAPVPVPIVVSQHVAEAAALRRTRSYLISAPHVNLLHLARFDERIAAHLDGVAVASDFGNQLAIAALESPGPGEVFVATIRAIHDQKPTLLDNLFSLAEALPAAYDGLTSAFGWVSMQILDKTVSNLLGQAEPLRRTAGIAACAMHRADPGAALNAASASPESRLRARALRCAGEVGRRDLLPVCVQQLTDKDPACAFWAAWSAVLLGDRGPAVESLKQLCLSPGVYQQRALQLVLKTLNNQDAHSLLRALAPSPANLRALIQGTGVAGDPFYVPWLIAQMAEDKTARLAGESFSFITGLDLARHDLQRPAAENPKDPNDDPNDDNVDMDPDDGLPWPDQVKVQAWWNGHGTKFTSGARYLVDATLSRGHCIDVLKGGHQRQRIAAAHHLCVLNPGTPLFNTSSPAWRQQRLLTQME